MTPGFPPRVCKGMNTIPGEATFFVIAAFISESKRSWVRKSGRDGRGVWKLTPYWDYAERMPSFARAKQALKSANLTRMKSNGLTLRIIEVKASYQTRKVWPLAPLEALAQVAK